MESVPFTQFKRADIELNRVLLLDLLLNGYSVEEIEKVEKITKHEPFAGIDRKTVRVYGLTREAVDINVFYQERENILTPTICSIQNYEMCTVSDVAYCYKAKDPEKPLKIHDLGVISPHMVITPDTVISSNKARPCTECEYGFTYFMDYVLYGKFSMDKWEVSYSNKKKEFVIQYNSKDKDGNIHTELIYQSTERSKDSTFALVLYLIKKVSANMGNTKQTMDCFVVERWKREK